MCDVRGGPRVKSCSRGQKVSHGDKNYPNSGKFRQNSGKFRQIRTNPDKTWPNPDKIWAKFPKIRQNPTKFPRIQQNPTKSDKIRQNPQKSAKNPQKFATPTLRFSETPRLYKVIVSETELRFYPYCTKNIG